MRDAHTAIGQTVNLVLGQAEGHPKTGPHASRRHRHRPAEPLPRDRDRGGSSHRDAGPGADRPECRQRRRAALPFLVRFAPGVSRDAGLAAITNDIKGFRTRVIIAAERPANVASLASIAGVPVALSVLLALIAAGTLAHTLASSTREGAMTWRS